MSFNSLFNSLWLNADVTLSGGVGFLCPLSPNQRTLTDACHSLHLAVGFTGVQKLNCMMQLSGGVLPGSALTVVGILSGNSFARLGTFHDHASFVLCEGQHDRQDEVTSEGVLNEAHVQDMYPNALLKKLPDRRPPPLWLFLRSDPACRLPRYPLAATSEKASKIEVFP